MDIQIQKKHYLIPRKYWGWIAGGIVLVGVLVGALAGHIANRFMGTQTSTGRNIVLGILGSFVGEFLFGLIGIHATGSISSFVISVLGACVCIWVDNRLFHDR